MPIHVQTVIDHQRGCGWRKEGGIYLRCDAPGVPCGKLPAPLTVCPCCGEGIKPARGWTWFNPGPFFKDIACALPERCGGCVVSNPPAKAGLLWIGEKFYPRPSDWLEEAHKLGVSRRLPRVPHGFEIGKTWVFAAHRKCIASSEDPEDFQAGIFHVFKPSRVEYVVTGKESEEDLEQLVKRGLTPVKVQRAGDLPLQK